MTEVLTGIRSETEVRVSISTQVLNVLSRISEGSLKSSMEINEVYCDVDNLFDRAQSARGKYPDLGISASPYLAHLKKMSEIEQAIITL